jgi:SprT-like family protein
MRTGPSRWFAELNARYWRGRLPRYRVIQRAGVPGDGRCNNARQTILLGPHPSSEDLRLTLLHEMCHSGTCRPEHDHHGPRFLRKMRRLVQLGETKLLEKDIRAFEAFLPAGHFSNSIPWQGALRSDIKSLAMDLELQWVRWPRVARYLANQRGMTISQLRRAAPWAERIWREKTAFLRADRRYQAQFDALFKAVRAKAGKKG